MNYEDVIGIPSGNAICYSGYREGQSPREQIYPSYDQVCEDLKILERNWKYLRIYDSSYHADLVLDVIQKEGFDFKVMLGADVGAEMNNPGCPWGAQYSEDELAANRIANEQQIERQIALAQKYSDSVFSLSVGNEASVDWTDHRVPVKRLIEFTRTIKQAVKHPVTFCENYIPWTQKLAPLVAELDFLSVHTYPVWEYQTIENALQYTIQNYKSVADCYPDKAVVITEAGWATKANGRGIDAWNASQELQAQYYTELMEWLESEGIMAFVFEAFDEPWKGSPDADEPEKHWGLFTVNRQPKQVMQVLYSDLA